MIAAPTIRRKSSDKSGGNIPLIKAQRAAEVPRANKTDGRISAARQQKTNATPNARAAAMRLRFTRRSSCTASLLLTGTILFVAEFTRRFLDIRIDLKLNARSGVVTIEYLQVFATHVQGALSKRMRAWRSAITRGK
jgi:hypothetical protein